MDVCGSTDCVNGRCAGHAKEEEEEEEKKKKKKKK
jgi:hypothetical protein